MFTAIYMPLTARLQGGWITLRGGVINLTQGAGTRGDGESEERGRFIFDRPCGAVKRMQPATGIAGCMYLVESSGCG